MTMRRSALLLACALAGCASPGPREALENERGEAVADRRAIGTAATGSVVTLPDSTERVRVSGEYHAASGRLCRRLDTLDAGGERRIACRADDGEWRLRRSLSALPASSGASGSIVPVAEAVDVAVAVASDSDLVLEPGETLWDFARRTTGSGVNWTEIARLNGVERPERLWAGTRLDVPLALRRRAD